MCFKSPSTAGKVSSMPEGPASGKSDGFYLLEIKIVQFVTVATPHFRIFRSVAYIIMVMFGDHWRGRLCRGDTLFSNEIRLRSGLCPSGHNRYNYPPGAICAHVFVF